MASVGGYDFKFIDNNKSKKSLCPVCTLVLRDPQITRCGHLICESCLQQLKDKGCNFTCPTCRADLNNNFFPDNYISRKIKSLQIYCNNKDDGCQWKGDLKDIEDHLQECPYQLVSCSNDCGMDLQRRRVKKHLKKHCPKRPIKCQYCNEDISIDIVTGDHLGVCPEYPTRCTNEGCGKKVLLRQIPSHKESCPKEMICCGYRSVGCEEKMKREEQEEHNEQWRERHLQLAVGKITDLQEQHQSAIDDIVKLKANNGNFQIPEKDNHIIIKFSDFTEHEELGIDWFSPAFYTSPGGYKMCLCVVANGDGDGEGTHVSCYVYLMSGEYDDILEWPFRGEVTIELLNQLEDKNHHKEVKYSCIHESRVIDEGRAVCGCRWGFDKFVLHAQLYFNDPYLNRQYLNCQYLKNDTLYFRVSINVISNTRPWLVA